MQQCWFISHDRGLDAFLTLQQAVCNRKSIDNKMVTGYTEFALRKMRIIKAVYFIIRSPVWSLRPDRRVTGEQSQKQYDNNDPPLKNSERSNFLGD